MGRARPLTRRFRVVQVRAALNFAGSRGRGKAVKRKRRSVSAESDRANARPDGPIQLFLCGDVMTGRGVDQILPYPCDPRLRDSYMDSAIDYVASPSNRLARFRARSISPMSGPPRLRS
jgi:hypothetical protein